MKHLRIRSTWCDFAPNRVRQAGPLSLALQVPATLRALVVLSVLVLAPMGAQAQVVPIDPPAKTLTRTTAYENDPATGLVRIEITEPNIVQLRADMEIAYDAWGNRNAITLSSPATGVATVATRTQTSTYDARGQFTTSSANSLLQSETITYDAASGLPKTVAGPNGLVTEYQYDELGRKTLEIYPTGNRKKWEYLYCGGSVVCPALAKYVAVTTPLNAVGAANGPWSKLYVDAIEREVATETVGFDGVSIQKTVTTYDSSGRVYQKSRPYFQGQTALLDTYAYDSLDRVVTITGPDNNASKVSYNGLEIVVRNALDQKRTTVKDVLGRISTITDAKGGVLRSEYDAFSNLYRTTDAANNTITMAYDIRGNKIRLIDPDMGPRSYVYDAFSQLVRETDAKGQAVVTAYDKLGRPTTRGETDLNTTWTYDNCSKGVGKICNAQADNGFVRNFSYDGYGRPSGISSTIDAVYSQSVTFDANGRVATQNYPNGFATKYVYTALGHLKEIRNNATNALYWRADSMNANGQLLQQTFGNNVVTQQVFHPVTGRIQNIFAGAGNAVQNLTYQFDPMGNLEKRSDPNQSLTEDFLYDPLRRLTSSTVNSGGAGIVTQSYGYSVIGNTISRSDLGTYVYCGVNKKPHAVRRVSFANGRTRVYDYDANSNLTSESEYDSANAIVAAKARSISYTSYNMPKTITTATASATFTYDTERQRVKQVSSSGTTIYFHPEGGTGLTYEKVSKPDSSVEHRYFIEAGDQLVAVVTQNGTALTTNYVHQDYLGSVTAMTNEAGAVVERFAYEPFGKRRTVNGSLDPDGLLKGANTNRGFTEHEQLDAFGLIHMNGRVYDPTIGRFMSADPNVPYAQDGQSYNRFSYARNNPLAYVDPSGFADIQVVEVVGPMIDRDLGVGIRNVFGRGQSFGEETRRYEISHQYTRSAQTGDQVIQTIAKRLFVIRTINMHDWRAGNARGFAGLMNGDAVDWGLRDAKVPKVGRRALRVLMNPRGAAVKLVILGVAIAANNAINNNSSASDPAAPPEPGEIPTIDWKDPTKAPTGPNGEKWEWRGKPPQGGEYGGYVNPNDKDQSVHPDLNHPAPVGPHWDYTDRKKDNPGWRVYPDGTIDKK